MRAILFLLAASVFGQSLNPVLVTVLGEVPIKTGAYTYMTVFVPAVGYACYYNGFRQKLGLDFTAAGNVLTAGHYADGSSFWLTDDKTNILQCDYAYQLKAVTRQ